MDLSVTVVGASVSGLFTAILLRRAGHAVTVLERAPAITATPRSLIVTSRFQDLLGPLATPAMVSRIDRFELIAGSARAEVPLRSPDLIIERASLVGSLAKEAEEIGVKLEPDTRFVGLATNGADIGLTVSSSNGSEGTISVGDVLIGADGANSDVARATGWGRVPTVPLVQAVVDLPEDLPALAARVWFRPQDTSFFYWLIPHGDDEGVLGIIGDDPSIVRRQLDSFLEELGLVSKSYQAALIPAYDRWMPFERRVGAARVFLVGDAAGHVKVTTVGGVVTSFKGCLAVADAVAGSGAGAMRSLKRELDAHLFIRRFMKGFDERDWARLLEAIDGAQAAVAKHTRDEAARVLIASVVRRPSIALIAARSLIRRAVRW